MNSPIIFQLLFLIGLPPFSFSFLQRTVEVNNHQYNPIPNKMSLGAINDLYLSHWDAIAAKLKGYASNEEIDGSSLDLATVIAIARYVGSVPPVLRHNIDSTLDMEHPHTCQTAASRLSSRPPKCSRRVSTKERSSMVRPVISKLRFLGLHGLRCQHWFRWQRQHAHKPSSGAPVKSLAHASIRRHCRRTKDQGSGVAARHRFKRHHQPVSTPS